MLKPVAPQQWGEQEGGEGAGEALAREEGGGNFSLACGGSRAGGANRRRARSAQRRVVLKGRPMASAPAPGLPVRAKFP
jgi:hypothetical protein